MFENNIELPLGSYPSPEQGRPVLDRQDLEQVVQTLVDYKAVINPRGRSFRARQAPDESQSISVALNLEGSGSDDISLFRLGFYGQQPEPETPLVTAVGRLDSVMVWEMIPLETRHGPVQIGRLRGLFGLMSDGSDPYAVRFDKGGVECSAVPIDHPAVQPLAQIIIRANSIYHRQPRPETAKIMPAAIPLAIGRIMLQPQSQAS
jgi:hypothetical protein